LPDYRLLTGRRLAHVALTISIGLASLGCSAVAGPSPGESGGTFAVPTYATGATVCMNASLVPFRLAGSADDPDHVWAVGEQLHNKIRLAWPSGFYARLQPQLEVFGGDGTVVAHGGVVIDDAGGGNGGNDTFDVCSIGGRNLLNP